ncbi:MAG: hypothetical protein ACLQVI_17715 [Polyangiaceae bacterium]
MKAQLLRLRAEVASDVAAWTARLGELRGVDLDAPTPATLAQAAVALHHAYGAVESALTRVARAFDGPPEGADWHQALLDAMALEIEGLRPAVLSPASVRDARVLLAFRHFFRHAYAATWDAERLTSLRATAVALDGPLLADFARLDLLLRDLAGRAGG